MTKKQKAIIRAEVSIIRNLACSFSHHQTTTLSPIIVSEVHQILCGLGNNLYNSTLTKKQLSIKSTKAV